MLEFCELMISCEREVWERGRETVESIGSSKALPGATWFSSRAVSHWCRAGLRSRPVTEPRFFSLGSWGAPVAGPGHCTAGVQ